MDPFLYPHVVRAIQKPWAILPTTMATIVDLVRMRTAGQVLSQEDVQARIEAARAEQGPRKGQRQRGNVAVIPIYGVLSPRANLMSQTSGGTSVESLRSMFREAMDDNDVDAIVFDVDSPGGQVDGIPELAAEIRAARGTKPILANANTMAASAAYWLASQADELTVSPSGVVGSIGVIAAHVDQSEADRMEGIKTTFVYQGKRKTEGNMHEPLGEEARAAIQTDVDAFYAMFTKDVARGRRVGIETARSDAWGAGATILADPALAAGMVDRIETLEETIKRAGRLAVTQARANASAFSSERVAAALDVPEELIGEDEEGLDELVDAGGIVESDADSSEALGSEPPISERLALVSEQLSATATHLQRHLDMRAREGRSLSQATRDRIERLLAVRPVLDEIEAMVRSEPPVATAPAGRRDLVLILQAEAAERGYALDL